MFFRKNKDDILKRRIKQLENQIDEVTTRLEYMNELAGTLRIEVNKKNEEIEYLKLKINNLEELKKEVLNTQKSNTSI